MKGAGFIRAGAQLRHITGFERAGETISILDHPCQRNATRRDFVGRMYVDEIIASQ